MKHQIPTETLVNEGTVHEEVRTDHPAFGMIVLTRGQSSGQNRLHGSDLNHGHTVTLCIHQGSTSRHLNQEWNRAEKMICEVEMSQAQFSRVVASAGIGEGTPCTIRQQQVGLLEQVPRIDKPSQSRSALHMKEVEAKMRQSLEGIQAVLAKMEGLTNASGSVPKKELKELVAEGLRLGEQLPGNLGFAQEQFRKAMETTVQDSKTEIEIFVASMERRVGPGLLASDFAVPRIEGPSDAIPV